ncbi:hypothetical protein EPUL_004469, partial [Erysiphe pulchra]
MSRWGFHIQFMPHRKGRLEARGNNPCYAEASNKYLLRILEANLPPKQSKLFPYYTTRIRKLSENSTKGEIWTSNRPSGWETGGEASEKSATNYLLIDGGMVTYVIDHVPRKLTYLEGKSWNVTEEDVRAEVQSITALVPIMVTWSRKTLTTPLLIGNIVVHLKQTTTPFRLFSSSSTVVILIQEPWVISQREGRILEKHSDYTPFCVIDPGDIHRRLMTYVKK